MVEDSPQEHDLEQARKALARGRPRKALRYTWNAGRAANLVADVDGLRAAIELATRIRDEEAGRLQREAGMAVVYFSHCLAEAMSPEAGRRRSVLGWFLGGGRSRKTKVCPDCAETINAGARVCRFCGYRFGADRS